MKIKIAHLYYDLMNLNGENGNLIALKEHFNKQKVNVEISFLTIGDKIDFKKYDIFYIGNSSRENFLLVLNDIKQYKKAIKEAINKNKYFFITGNALELFGKDYETISWHKIDCLDLFSYSAKEIDFKIIGEQIYSTNLIDKKIIGFQNRTSIIKNCTDNLFEVERGTGYVPNVKIEGFNNNNFYATYLLGPLFIRNPYLTDFFVNKILSEKKIDYKNTTSSFEYTAYNEYLNNFVSQK